MPARDIDLRTLPAEVQLPPGRRSLTLGWQEASIVRVLTYLSKPDGAKYKKLRDSKQLTVEANFPRLFIQTSRATIRPSARLLLLSPFSMGPGPLARYATSLGASA